MKRRFSKAAVQISVILVAVFLVAVIGRPVAPAIAQSLLETKAATASCGASGNSYQDVRFTLAAAADVRVRFDVDGNWWIRLEPAGPLVAQVLDGKVTIPDGASVGGGTLREISLGLSAGTYVLHSDCSGPSPGRDSRTTVEVPASPSPPPGPTYHVVSRAHAEPSGPAPNGWVHGYNDRIFLLAARQVVSFYPNPFTSPSLSQGSTGWIADFAGTTWWAIDNGTIRSRSTLDLPAGAYCLHVDWAKDLAVQISDQWVLQIVGPGQPTGPGGSATAIYDPNPIGNQVKFQDAAFVLPAAQVVTFGPINGSPEPTFWIVDSSGVTWYKSLNGLTQSYSAEANPAPGTPPGTPPAVEGIMLPAGTYLLHVDQGGVGSGQTSVTLNFVGTEIPAFAWPSPMRCPCWDKPRAASGCVAWDIPCQIAAIRREIERRINEEIERQLSRYIEQLCSTAMLPPALALAAAWSLRPRRRD